MKYENPKWLAAFVLLAAFAVAACDRAKDETPALGVNHQCDPSDNCGQAIGVGNAARCNPDCEPGYICDSFTKTCVPAPEPDAGLPDAAIDATVEVCGDDIVNQAGEVCDGGQFCLQGCLCPDGYVTDGGNGCMSVTPDPVCGDNIVDPGEVCDGGTGCLQNCQCPAGFSRDGNGGCAETPPPPARCGDGVRNQNNEQCDGGLGCLQTCLCLPGFGPDGDGGCMENAPPAPRCGDDILNQASEECDGGDNCLQTCLCLVGYQADGDGGCLQIMPPPAQCGDNVVNQASEQCDGGVNCRANCTCPAGFNPDGNGGCSANPPPAPRCGDNVVNQASEVCDGGVLCQQNCRCPAGYLPNGNAGCQLPAPPPTPEVCDNLEDDDDDGLVDCEDPDCAAHDVAGYLWIFRPAGTANIRTQEPADLVQDFALEAQLWTTFAFYCSEVGANNEGVLMNIHGGVPGPTEIMSMMWDEDTLEFVPAQEQFSAWAPWPAGDVPMAPPGGPDFIGTHYTVDHRVDPGLLLHFPH